MNEAEDCATVYNIIYALKCEICCIPMHKYFCKHLDQLDWNFTLAVPHQNTQTQKPKPEIPKPEISKPKIPKNPKKPRPKYPKSKIPEAKIPNVLKYPRPKYPSLKQQS